MKNLLVRIRASLKARAIVSAIGLVAVVNLTLLLLLGPLLRDLVTTEREASLRSIVDLGHSQLAALDAKVKAGTLPLEQAKSQAIELLRATRYRDNDYLWINDTALPVPRMIMHATVPALDGQVMDAEKYRCAGSMRVGRNGATTDIPRHDKNLFAAFVEVCQGAGDGYVTYDWPKVSKEGVSKELYPKCSYVRLFEPWGWILGTGLYVDDLERQVASLERKVVLGLLLFSLLLLVGIWLLVDRALVRPIRRCVDAVGLLATGDLTAKVELQRTDELGTLATSINTCTDTLRTMVAELSRTSTSLVGAADQMKETAHAQASGAEQTNVQASTVAAAGEQLAANSRSMSEAAGQIQQSAAAVATAVEQMSASIRDVSVHCAEESNIAKQADAQARQTREMMTRLDTSAREIGKVVEVIKGLADQTNLLSLNAAIEAATAGAAGRGFAIVANEVKELARQSAAATVEIQKQVTLIQDNTGNAVKAIGDVGKVIEKVSGIATTIAAAVEQQSATTSGIVDSLHAVTSATTTLSGNVQQTSTGVADVAHNISGVSAAAADAAKGANQISASANGLHELAGSLGQLVGRFKV